MITRIQEVIEFIKNRSSWILEIMNDEGKIVSFHTKEEALKYQMEILDSTIKEYQELRNKNG